MVYIIDHYCFYDNKKYCLIVKSDKAAAEVIEICLSIEFLFEKLVSKEYDSLDFECLLKILTRYYGMKDVKEAFRDNLSNIHLPVRTFTKDIGSFSYYDKDVGGVVTTPTVVIDLYDARESQYASNSRNVMRKWLPKGKDLEDIEVLLLTEGKEV